MLAYGKTGGIRVTISNIFKITRSADDTQMWCLRPCLFISGVVLAKLSQIFAQEIVLWNPALLPIGVTFSLSDGIRRQISPLLTMRQYHLSARPRKRRCHAGLCYHGNHRDSTNPTSGNMGGFFVWTIMFEILNVCFTIFQQFIPNWYFILHYFALRIKYTINV